MTYNDQIKSNINKIYNTKLESANGKIYKKARKFFFTKTRSIEIVNQDQKLQRIFFPLPPISRLHSQFNREKFESEVPRDSINDKLSGLMEEVPFLVIELGHFNSLLLPSLKITTFYVFQRLNFLIALALNTLIVVLPNLEDEF
jgi:hypothetical protein